MKDEYGRTNTRAQAIRSLDNLRIAMFLEDIKRNPEKYPDDKNDWVEWLNQKSGRDILSL